MAEGIQQLAMTGGSSKNMDIEDDEITAGAPAGTREDMLEEGQKDLQVDEEIKEQWEK